MFFVFFLVFSWQFQHIDKVSARTTIRLWHEMHILRKIPHDFISLFEPNIEGLYVAAVRHGEIKSIALCSSIDTRILTICNIAHAPEEFYAACKLIELANTRGIKSDWNKLKSQPRWFCEQIYQTK